jgi:hypothetical protein
MKLLRITLFLACAAGYVIYSNTEPDPHFYRRLAMAVAVVAATLVTRKWSAPAGPEPLSADYECRQS